MLLLKITCRRHVLFIAIAPIFIVKLPKEKTIKVGATLLFNCLVEKAKLKECVAGDDIIAKGYFTATLYTNINK